MAQTQAQIQKKSDEKRGVKLCSFKFHKETIELLNHAAEQSGLSKTALLAAALQEYAEKHNLNTMD